MSGTTDWATPGGQEKVSMPGRGRAVGEERAGEGGEQEEEQDVKHDGEWRRSGP